MVVLCYPKSRFSEGALQPMHDFDHWMTLAHLAQLTLLDCKHYTVRPNAAGCDVFLLKGYRSDRGFGMGNLFHPKTSFCVTINNYSFAQLFGTQFVQGGTAVPPRCDRTWIARWSDPFFVHPMKHRGPDSKILCKAAAALTIDDMLLGWGREMTRDR